MKRLLFACFMLLTVLIKAQSFTFTLNNQSSSYSITCTNTLVSLYAIANTGNPLQCTWFGPGSVTVTGNPQTFTTTGNYTVTVKDVVTNSVASQQFSIYQNTVAPGNTVSPSSQVVTCAAPAATFTSTALNPTVNIEHHWYSPSSSYPSGPISSIANSQSSIFTGLAPGVYTVDVCDLNNGCCTPKTFTVNSTSGFPTFNATSANNFSVGCTPLNQTTICITNVVSASSGPVNFAILPPGTFSSVPLPASAFSNQSCTITSAPGTWTLVANDAINNCQTAVPVTVIQNTVPPPVPVVALPSKTLTCSNPTILALGYCQVFYAAVTWIVPSVPPSIPVSSVIVGPPTGPATSTTSSSYANYTVVATNTVNGCKSYSVINISQNFVSPIPAIALGNPSVITCSGNPVVLAFTAVQNPNPGSISVVQSWQGPAPQATASAVNSYSAYVAGIYTLTVFDNMTGCVGTRTIVVNENTYNGAGPATYTITCPGTATIAPTFTGSSANYSFTWTALSGSSPINGSTNTMSVTVNGGGTYLCTSTNNSNACSRTDTIQVYACVGLANIKQANDNIKLYPNPASTYIDINISGGSNASFLIMDMQGRIILSESLARKSNRIYLNLAKGFYIARVIVGTGYKDEKLLIE
jgi:hypothetical protein